MQLDIANMVLTAVWPPTVAALWLLPRRFRGLPPKPGAFCENWTWSAGGDVIAQLINGEIPALIIAVANLVLAAICWWLSRRKRKRSAGLIGAKARALLASVVARMRETAKPRQVLRPVPGGAR